MGEDSKHPKERREIPTRKLPGKKPSGKMIKIVPRGYAVEKGQGETTTGPPPQEIEAPKGGFDDVVGPKHWVKVGEPAHPPPPKPKPNLARNAIVAAVSFGITFVVVGGIIWINAPWLFGDGGGGGGGGGGIGGYDGTYNGNVTTVTPIGTTSLSGTFTVVNGYVSDPGGTFTGTVDANGNFAGTTIVSQGSPLMAMTGQFSLTGNFTIYGSSGNVSQTIVAYKVY